MNVRRISIVVFMLAATSSAASIAGTGFGYETSRGLLTFDARFQRGFTDIVETIEFDFLGSTQMINVDQFEHYGFSFMVGFQF